MSDMSYSSASQLACKVINKLSRTGRILTGSIKARNKPKYFCIGRNKTGTTSLRKAFEDLGFPVGDQYRAEQLANENYFKGNFQPIVDYCKHAQVFQDVPFSWDGTYEIMDKEFPGSKFILSIRDDAEQWYRSITRFHAKKFGNGSIPTADDLRNANYVAPGYMYRAVKLHGAPDEDIYNHAILVSHYNEYNRKAIEYFQDRPGDLLVINVAEHEAYQKFADFLGVQADNKRFPWENKT